jgi:ABC-type transport system involved in multi-copper enzyme maturation permease subunit
MTGLVRAEVLRLRKRRSLQVIVLGAPLLIAVLFVMGWSSIYANPPFDAAAYRAQLIADGYVAGLPPEQAEPLLAEAVEQARQQYAFAEAGEANQRAAHLFPYSLATVMGSSVIVLVALLLLAATTTGDEFGWGTIRGMLLASGHRRKILAVRMAALAVAAVVMIGLTLVVGAILPFVLNVAAYRLPDPLPMFDYGALLVLIGGITVAALFMVCFAVLATLAFRSGPVALIVLPVWVAVESAILALLMRFPNIGGQMVIGGPPGPDAWILELFPLRGLTTLMNVATAAAVGFPPYPDAPFSRSLAGVEVPILSFAVVALLFGALAFRRFNRMDIVE